MILFLILVVAQSFVYIYIYIYILAHFYKQLQCLSVCSNTSSLTIIELSCKQTCPKLRDLAESLEGAQRKLFSYQDSLYERINKLGCMYSRHFLHPWPVILVYISVGGRRVPFLHPCPVTFMYISVCGRRVPLLATSDSLTFQRARQQTRQTGVELL